MDASCIILGCLLLIQMAVILVLLNPIYDLRRVTKYMNNITKRHRSFCSFLIATYFSFILYHGMYMPLQDVYNLIANNFLNEYEKMVLLSRVEKNYLIAGFSLFLFIVLYGIRSLVSYASSLLELSIATGESKVLHPSYKSQKKTVFLPELILPNLLRVKRSVSYETILFAKELREQLKTILKNAEFSDNSWPISNILHTDVNSLYSS
ncbi:uncharacterized protein LOC123659247 [Melitaea cinxia]|uniref:uncharacterized protein LOC123659247 n=1 Tax=Melitaea cinxia TaxID=113334 RepID=UPI001E2712E1|nr:uncharacterized protein LOC123659247 [Melitaea cinxia]